VPSRRCDFLRKAHFLAVLAVGVLGAMAFRLSGPSLRFPYATHAKATDLSTLKGFEGMAVVVAPGVTVRGIRRAPNDAGAPWVVFFHGNDPAQLASGAALLEGLAASRDVGVAMMAYRGFDGSQGTPSPEVLFGDALTFVRALGVEPGRVELLGFSLGAPVVTHLAAALHRLGTPPASVTLLAPAQALAMLHAGPWARLSRGEVYAIGDEWEALRCPLHVIHGTADSTLPIEGSRALVKRAGTMATLTELPGVDHASILTGYPKLVAGTP
jgi:uncharacterized protein